MKRIQLFEFEDFEWFPGVIRIGATNLIVVLHKIMGTAEVISELIFDIKQTYEFTQVVDLGSGSGGPMPDAINRVNEKYKNQPINLILTDLHPNPDFVAEINKRKLPNTEYYGTSVDATNISEAPEGLKTMIASFHHMNPEIAKKILQSAKNNKEPILIYEIAKNTVPLLLWVLFLPISLIIMLLMSLLLTPFVRPLKFSQLLFTYLIPLIPLVFAWDGQASLMRTYTFKDIESLIGQMEDDDYKWTIGDAKKADGKKVGYYIIGCPKT